MAKVPSKHSRDQAKDFEGLLNNLEDWELSFKDKDKKLRSDSIGKKKLDLPVPKSRINSDTLKDYDALSRLSSGFSSGEGSIDANSEKELGNELFKQKKFNEAIDCYSRSIALSPTAVAYANRAMAFIKIKRFQEAESDCTEALNLDDRYIKAYSRRSTARKELGKLKESIEDAEFALRLEPQNQEIKKQYAEAKSLFQKEILKKASGSLKSKVDKNVPVPKPQSFLTNSPTGKIEEIVEDHAKDQSTRINDTREVPAENSMKMKDRSMIINGSDADVGLETVKRNHKDVNQNVKSSVQEYAAKAANLAKAEAAKNIVPPESAYQFEVSWKGLSGDRGLQARLLKLTPASRLPRIFKNALTAPILVDIIRCIASFFLEHMDLAVNYLQNLVTVPRFDMIIMCLSSADKADLVKIWDDVFSKGTTDYAKILDNLRSRYGIKQ